MKCLRCGDSINNPKPVDGDHDDWFRYRLRATFLQRGRCPNCGVGLKRRVQRHRRRGPIASKRGRNSGKVSQHGKRGNTG